MLEDDDQRGLAHFVEHMSFNGTLHFPRQDLGSFMQSLGMRFGAHVNAHTSFDETVYALQIPTGNAAVIDRSLLILEDWARDVSFDPVEIDKERGAATVVGLEVPPRSTNLDIKPFAITDLTSDRTVMPPVSNALGGDVGLDVKYGGRDMAAPCCFSSGMATTVTPRRLAVYDFDNDEWRNERV